MKRYGQIKTKKETPRRYSVEEAVQRPQRLSITVMSSADKLEVNRKRVGSRAVPRGIHPYNAPSYSRPVSSR